MDKSQHVTGNNNALTSSEGAGASARISASDGSSLVGGDSVVSARTWASFKAVEILAVLLSAGMLCGAIFFIGDDPAVESVKICGFEMGKGSLRALLIIGAVAVGVSPFFSRLKLKTA